MKKLGKIFLFVLNILINIFLISIFVVLTVWAVWDVSPDKSVQQVFLWIENKWDRLTNTASEEKMKDLSKKYQKRARRHLYILENKKPSQEDRLTQPYMYK